MAKKGEKSTKKKEAKEKTCFVIMPISDVGGYETGHFDRVYNYLIVPACKKAGFTPLRADEVNMTNYIVIDILKRIMDSDLVLCDLSTKNPNVLYELGIRQAFNKPVTLIKDEDTDRIFDIQGFRYVEYHKDLRIDEVETEIDRIAQAMIDTHTSSADEVNSLVQLLGIEPATTPVTIELSEDTSLVLGAIKEIGSRLEKMEDQMGRRPQFWGPRTVPVLRKGDVRKMFEADMLGLGFEPKSLREYVLSGRLRNAIGKRFYHKGQFFGELTAYSHDGEIFTFMKGDHKLAHLKKSDPILDELELMIEKNG